MLSDIANLRASNAVPMHLIKIIQADLLHLFNTDKPNDYLFKMRLPRQHALVLLEAGDDVKKELGHVLYIEYVEKLEHEGMEYYRMAKRLDHEFQLLYTLTGIHDQEIEAWLAEQAE